MRKVVAYQKLSKIVLFIFIIWDKYNVFTQNTIAVTPLTPRLRQFPNCVNHILGVYKKILKFRLNVFCLPVDPMSFRHIWQLWRNT